MDSNLYQGWLPENWYYFFHLVAWMGPVVLLQWLIGWKIFCANKRAVFAPVVLVGSYLIATDLVAVELGIWFFDPDLILSGLVQPQNSPALHFLLQPFGVPVEEWLFFYLTALLCSQSFLLFLPDSYRQSGRSSLGETDKGSINRAIRGSQIDQQRVIVPNNSLGIVPEGSVPKILPN